MGGQAQKKLSATKDEEEPDSDSKSELVVEPQTESEPKSEPFLEKKSKSEAVLENTSKSEPALETKPEPIITTSQSEGGFEVSSSLVTFSTDLAEIIPDNCCR